MNVGWHFLIALAFDLSFKKDEKQIDSVKKNKYLNHKSLKLLE